MYLMYVYDVAHFLNGALLEHVNQIKWHKIAASDASVVIHYLNDTATWKQ